MTRRLTVSVLAIALAATSAVGIAACGGDDANLLPGQTAKEIIANLDQVEELAQSGDCEGAEAAARQVGEQVDALGGVDKKLKDALREGAEKLNEVVSSCVSTETVPVTPTTTTEAVAPEEPEKGGKKGANKEKAKPEKPGKGPKEKGPKEGPSQEETQPATPTQPSETTPKGPSSTTPPSNSNGQGQGTGGTPSGGLSPAGPAGEGP